MQNAGTYSTLHVPRRFQSGDERILLEYLACMDQLSETIENLPSLVEDSHSHLNQAAHGPPLDHFPEHAVTPSMERPEDPLSGQRDTTFSSDHIWRRGGGGLADPKIISVPLPSCAYVPPYHDMSSDPIGVFLSTPTRLNGGGWLSRKRKICSALKK